MREEDCVFSSCERLKSKEEIIESDD